MIGREKQIERMKYLLKTNKSEFVAVTGRRRVGKTFLIDTVYRKQICFMITGIQHGNMEDQLMNFAIKLSEYTKNPVLSPPKDWQEAFYQLKSYLKSLSKRSKKVIFIDELPWIYTKRSKFIQMLAHLWNDYLSKEKHFVLVICGSASSLVTKNIVNDKGGLHNRLSEIIRLKPFTLSETKMFLKSRRINLVDQEITKLYMALGGVPFYLEQIRKGESAVVALQRLCFSADAIFKNEYDNLYKALFYNAEKHEAIVALLAKSKDGLIRKQIREKIIAKGSYNRTMEDLILSGFVTEHLPFGGKTHGTIYRLDDEYSVFYHRFIKPNKKQSKGAWLKLSASQAYKIWTGYAFESICHKHIDEIKQALGISGVYTEISALRVQGNAIEKGFQIDLIIDRNDNTINICEIKYYGGTFKIDKAYAKTLIERKQMFIEKTRTKKQVFNTIITNYDVLSNQYSLAVAEAEITLKSLM
ncbi:MAG: ATP-binding protein [Saprospiraceae bacterium]